MELKKRIQQLEKKKPGYKEILNFYQKVRVEQGNVKPFLKLGSPVFNKERKKLLRQEGFPLFEKKDFPLDTESSIKLFHALCQIGKDATSHMAEQMKKTEKLLDNKKMDLEKIFIGGFKEDNIKKVADKFQLDKKILLFLVQESIKPSIEDVIEKLLDEVETKNWTRGYCPICGSLPHLSLLKDEIGKRYLVCSFCSYQWRADRLTCPFCDKKQESHQYFYGEGEEGYRIDLCDECHQYIKTIDLRKIEDPDPYLEDIATFHLDILAMQKGYKRPIPNPWTT